MGKRFSPSENVDAINFQMKQGVRGSCPRRPSAPNPAVKSVESLRQRVTLFAYPDIATDQKIWRQSLAELIERRGSARNSP